MHSLRKELSYGIRGLIKSPLFSITAIISLALGIGANTAIFSLLYQVLLRALPLRAPQEIVMPGAHPLAILSYGFWQRRFGGDRSILGQTVEVNSTPLTIIGVAPPGFEGLD